LEAGQRLIHLYEVKSDVALLCSLLSLNTVLTISHWLYGDENLNEIMERCHHMNEKVGTYSVKKGLAKVGGGSLVFEVLTKAEEYGTAPHPTLPLKGGGANL
jgi:hypothetical protein